MANASRDVAGAEAFGPGAPAVEAKEPLAAEPCASPMPTAGPPAVGENAAQATTEPVPETLRGEALAAWSNVPPAPQEAEAAPTTCAPTLRPSEPAEPDRAERAGVGIGWAWHSATPGRARSTHEQQVGYLHLHRVSYTERTDAEAASGSGAGSGSEQSADAPPASSSPDGERRSGPRHPCELSVEFEDETHFLAGLSFDVSRGGIFIATYRPLPVGTRISLRFVLPTDGSVVRARGQVRWVRDTPLSDTRPGMGIAFTSLDPAAVPAITEFCAIRPPLLFDFDDVPHRDS